MARWLICLLFNHDDSTDLWIWEAGKQGYIVCRRCGRKL